ncbi:MAG: FAD-binding oxidoreductase [Rhodobacteraceae bacterium]|nr:FAD-binding oxidoreductase [Paracoccaceae bacterium]MCY4196403.1 FAD-binding oxidoreductase [Paracoccaceae bacterium]
MNRADVEIFGGGIFGLSIAYCCARRGAQVRVIEKRRIGAGASGGLLGAMTPHVPDAWNEKKQFQFDSLTMAAEWWGEAARISGVSPRYRRCGRLQPIHDQRAMILAKERRTAAHIHWSAQAEWQIIEAKGDWVPLSRTGYVIHDTLSASLNPSLALKCLATAVRQLGGVIDETRTKGHGADLTLHATGYEGLEELGQILNSDIGRGETGQVAMLKFDSPYTTQIFADGIHVVPHEGGRVAVGSTSQKRRLDHELAAWALDDLIQRAKDKIPVLRDAPMIECWTGTRPRAASRAPLLGPYPGRPGHFIANGGFKIGLGLAPLVGEVMADLTLASINRIPDEFSPQRVAERYRDSRHRQSITRY